MQTVKTGTSTTVEIEIKRSRFISTLSRCDSEAEARDHVNLARKTFPDARHHCSAFVVQHEGMNPTLHSSDDGEPAGTAGMPMLEVLRHSGLENVVAVVTRYFGGTLLGTGGLVRAYSHSVQEAIKAAPLVELRTLTLFQATVPLAFAGRVEGEMRSTGWDVTDASWADTLVLEIAAQSTDEKKLNSQLAILMRSDLAFHQVGTLRREVDSTGP